MKKLYILLFALVWMTAANTQGCLPEGIYFETQSKIDSFQINYPNCTEIEGSVYLWNDDITNLNGLSILTSIAGDLSISNTALTNFSGFENLTSIAGSLYIDIDWQGAGNPALTSFAGLQGLSSIGGQFYICRNEILNDISDLINLTSVGGELRITDNPLLPSISGLDNIVAGSITSLDIYGNDLLSECDVQSICEYLVSPNGSININNNAPGCNSQQEVEDACMSHCLPEEITFTAQEEIDNFQINYPGCTEIEGDVHIDGESISNLSGLNVLTSIGGFLTIINTNLPNLDGLENLIFVGGDLRIGIAFNGWGQPNPVLSNLSALGNLTSVGQSLRIGSNPTLVSLSGLENLNSIGWWLEISSNNSLTSLIGLENIEADSIGQLTIVGNEMLSTCDVQSICDYLAAPNGSVYISANAPGCNSPEEVQEACLTSTEDHLKDIEFTISPNPVSGYAEISWNSHKGQLVEISLFNTTGICVKNRQYLQNQTGKNIFILDLKELPKGIYFCRVEIGSEIATSKVVKY
jgi:hypothetical protein